MRVPAEPVSIVQAAQKGSKDATVAVLAFSDFECPFCARFAQGLLKDLESRYITSGRVLLAFRHLPLEAIHPQARGAALGAECARRQNRFWELHDRLFASPKSLSTQFIEKQAIEGRLDLKAFTACMSSPPDRAIDADIALARSLGISGTPTFLIGTLNDQAIRVTTVLEGANSPGRFAAALDNLLQR
jgi:protein-disulfide isomerase